MLELCVRVKRVKRVTRILPVTEGIICLEKRKSRQIQFFKMTPVEIFIYSQRCFLANFTERGQYADIIPPPRSNKKASFSYLKSAAV